jgi:hypothetical protein
MAPPLPAPPGDFFHRSETSMSAHHSSRLALPLIAALALTGRSAAAGLEPRVPAAICLSEAGHLISHEGAGQPWRLPSNGEALSSRDLLMALPGLRGEFEPRPKSVHVTLWGQLPGFSAFNGLESAIILHDSRAFDLDFSLLRGRVVLANRKATGAARAWVRLMNDAGELTLLDPGTEVALEIDGRWPRGVPYVRDPRPVDRPTTEVTVLVLKGSAELRVGKIQHRLSAPPGPASFSWDSVAGPADSPEHLDRLPRWARLSSLPGSWVMPLRTFAETVARKGPSDAPRQLLETAKVAGADDAGRWYLLGILTQTAIGEIDRVIDALADTSAEARNAAVIGLRHWIGEAAGRDQQLARLIAETPGYSKPQAETVLQLLHSPFATDQPETYETLIAYLRHPKLGVRHLAYWHLQRLVPDDLVVAYDAAAPEADRVKAANHWKKNIPTGSLPRRETPKDRR